MFSAPVLVLALLTCLAALPLAYTLRGTAAGTFAAAVNLAAAATVALDDVAALHAVAAAAIAVAGAALLVVPRTRS